MSAAEDYDLYGDLDGADNKSETQDDNFEDELDLLPSANILKSENNSKTTEAELKELKEKLEIAHKQLEDEIARKEKISFNFKVMLQTARNEIERKKYEIHTLQKEKDDLAFRRQRPAADQEFENVRRRNLRSVETKSVKTQTTSLRTISVSTQTGSIDNHRKPSIDSTKEKESRLNDHSKFSKPGKMRHDLQRVQSDRDHHPRKRSRSPRSPERISYKEYKRRRYSEDERDSEKSRSRSKGKKDIDLRETLLKRKLSKEVKRTVNEEILKHSIERSKSSEKKEKSQITSEVKDNQVSQNQSKQSKLPEMNSSKTKPTSFNAGDFVNEIQAVLDLSPETVSKPKDSTDKTDHVSGKKEVSNENHKVVLTPDPKELVLPETAEEDGIEDGEIVEDEIEKTEIKENVKATTAVTDLKKKQSDDKNEMLSAKQKKSKSKKESKNQSPIKKVKIRSPIKSKSKKKIESPQKKSVKSSKRDKTKSPNKKVLNGNSHVINGKSPRKKKEEKVEKVLEKKVEKVVEKLLEPKENEGTNFANSPMKEKAISPIKAPPLNLSEASTINGDAVEPPKPFEVDHSPIHCSSPAQTSAKFTPDTSLNSPLKLNGSSHSINELTSPKEGGSSKENSLSFTTKRRSYTTEFNDEGIAVVTITRHKTKKKKKSSK